MKDNKLEVGDVIYALTPGGAILDRFTVTQVTERHAIAGVRWFDLNASGDLSPADGTRKYNLTVYSLETEELKSKWDGFVLLDKIRRMLSIPIPDGAGLEKLKSILAILETPDGN